MQALFSLRCLAHTQAFAEAIKRLLASNGFVKFLDPLVQLELLDSIAQSSHLDLLTELERLMRLKSDQLQLDYEVIEKIQEVVL